MLKLKSFEIEREMVDSDNIEIDPDDECVFIPLKSPWNKYVDTQDPEEINSIWISCSLSVLGTYLEIEIGEGVKDISWQPNQKELQVIGTILKECGCYAE